MTGRMKDERETKPKKFIKLRESACILVDKKTRDKLGWNLDSKFTLTVQGDKLVVEKAQQSNV